MLKPYKIFLLISAIVLLIPLSEAQVIKRQLRSLPIEINEAKLVGQDLYVGSTVGLYHTNIDNIDFKRLSFSPVTGMRPVGDRVFYNTRSSTTFSPSYCNGGGLTSRTTLATRSAQGETIRGHNSYTYESTSGSTNGGTNKGFNVTDNGTIYSRIYRLSGWPGNYETGKPVAFDKNGNSFGSLDTEYQSYASDAQYYYAILGNQIYRSESPTFATYEIISNESTPTSASIIFHINGQLFIVGTDGHYVSEDQGESWESFDFPHAGWWFDRFEDGLYYFTNDSKKLSVSTDSYFSTDYDTIYNVIAEPFLEDKRFMPLNKDTFLASQDKDIYISYDQGNSWEKVFTGFWFNSMQKPAVTEQTRFFQQEGKFYRTADEGLTFEEFNPIFISTSGSTVGNIDYFDFTGHHDVLFCDARFDDGTHRLFRSIDQGDTFHEEYNSELVNFYNGVDDIFAITDNTLHTSSDDGVSWSELIISEIDDANDYNSITDIQQESNIVLIEYLGAQYYVSYDFGASFSRLQFPDEASYKISLVNGRLFAIGYRGSTWIKYSNVTSWRITSPEASFFNTNPNDPASSSSTTKIHSLGGTTIYSKFYKSGYLYEQCQYGSASSFQYSENFGATWIPASSTNLNTFIHNEDHYTYNSGFFKYSLMDTIHIFEILELCEGEDFNGIQINQDTTVVSSSQGISTYDIYTTEITVTSSPTDTIQAILCEGYTIFHNDIEYNSPGIYFLDSLQTFEHGCDSLVMLNVQEVESHVNNISLDIAAGEQFEDILIYHDTVITQVFIDTNGCDSIYIYDINVSEAVGVSNSIDNQYILSPNPTSDILRITSLHSDQIIRIEVTDLSGRIKSTLKNTSSLSSNLEIDITPLSQGIYFLTIHDNHGSHTQKIVKL